MSGRSSGVEHNLAKVGVGRSNRLARSIIFIQLVDLARICAAAVLQFVGTRVSIVEARNSALAS